MKRLILSTLFIPFAVQAGFKGGHISLAGHTSSPNQVEVRSGAWPIYLEKTMERSGASYSLQFRDQQVMSEVVMDTLPFPDIGQLRYFGKALSALKTGTNGDIAKFKHYSVARTDKKYEGVFYLLKYQWGSTEFRQPEADLMISTINGF